MWEEPWDLEHGAQEKKGGLWEDRAWVSGLCDGLLPRLPSTTPTSLTMIQLAPHPFQVACCLEVDEVGLPGLKRWVPEAAIGLVVTHSKGHGLGQTAGCQFSPKVVHQATSQRCLEGQRHWEAVLATWLPPQSPRPLLLHNHLVYAGRGQHK